MLRRMHPSAFLMGPLKLGERGWVDVFLILHWSRLPTHFLDEREREDSCYFPDERDREWKGRVETHRERNTHWERVGGREKNRNTKRKAERQRERMRERERERMSEQTLFYFILFADNSREIFPCVWKFVRLVQPHQRWDIHSGHSLTGERGKHGVGIFPGTLSKWQWDRLDGTLG